MAMTPGRFLVLLAGTVLALAHARAEPLDADSCTQLKTEHSQLEVAGVGLNMAKGPEWAKANLAPENLDQIRRFIEVQEQLLFRCRDGSLVNLHEPDPAPAGNAGDKGRKRPAANAAAPPKKTKASTAARKKTERAKRAKVRRQPKRAPRQAKRNATKTKSPAAKKQPDAAGAEPAPPVATGDGAK